LSELVHSLAALHAKASFLIMDGARASPFLLSSRPPASGFAWMEPEANVLLAFNAAPGTVVRDGTEVYGAYARALAEMIGQGGLGPEDLFDRVRLRVTELTGGAQVPWDAANIRTRFKFSEPGTDAPKLGDSPQRAAWMRSQPMRKLSPDEAFWVALLRDTFDGYAEFLAEYKNDPMARRIEVLLAARRESITWRRSNQANVTDAYWTYLELYPHGPHVADAERLLAQLGAPTTPLPRFRRLDYDVPPPLPTELELTDQAELSLDDPAFAPLKPPPAYFLEAPPAELQASGQKVAPSVKSAVTMPPSLPSPRPPQIAGPPDRTSSSSTRTTAGKLMSDGPETAEGQRGSLLSSSPGVPPSTSAMSPGGPADQKASPGLSVPAWASLLPKDNKTSDALGPASSNSIQVPLFVSAALAVVSEPTGPDALANVRTGSERASPQAPLSGGLTGVPATAGRARPAQANRLQGRAPPVQGEPGQSPPLPTTRPTRIVAPLPGSVPRPSARAAPTPKAGDQAVQLSARKPSPTPKSSPEPSSPDETSAASAPQPEENPCIVSDGRLECGNSR
jgi:uncharacterized caspase-like protein